MLNKDIFTEQMEVLADSFPMWKLDIGNTRILKNWYVRFEDFEDDQFVRTISKFCKTSKFAPTIAGLIECKARVITKATWTKRSDKEEHNGYAD